MSTATAPRPPIRLRVLPGVFRPRSDAGLLSGVMAAHGLAKGLDVLDVFTGSGVLALSAARHGARSVTAVDVSRRAVLTARRNAVRNGVSIEVLRGDLFDPVRGRTFDLITANPPYLPGAEAIPDRGAARAWEGGRDGRVVVDRLCAEAGQYLRPRGRLLLVQSSLTGEHETLRRLHAGGFSTEVLARHRGQFGPLARARLEAATAMSAGSASASDLEELQVILATAG